MMGEASRNGVFFVTVWNSNEQWFASILDTIDEGIHAVDKDGVTVVYNQAAGRMDGLAPADVIGKHVLDVFPSLGQDTSTLVQVLHTGRAIRNRQQTYTNVHGMKVHTVNTTLPIQSGGVVVGALEVAKDLTQVKHLAEQVVHLQAQMVGGARKRRLESPDGASLAIYRFQQILTRDSAMQDAKQRAERAAKTSSPVLVYGETGTGKELMVQAIHNASPRQTEPFLALNCAALPATLLEGILFGTVRGSFTGAGDRPGMFELADGGTLFLDEIQSMPLDLQAKLLRVLQEGEVIRVGDTRVRRLSVRVIAAMNQRPEEALDEAKLRHDLYYRINVVRIDLPPLRQREVDLPLLVAHFIEKCNGRFQANVTGIDDDVKALFAAYPWPGNVRELENAIEAAMNLVAAGQISVKDLPVQIREWAVRNGSTLVETGDHAAEDTRGERAAMAPVLGAHAEKLAQPMEAVMESAAFDGSPAVDWVSGMRQAGMDVFWSELATAGSTTQRLDAMAFAFERLILARALANCGGNVKKTAEKIGLARQTLQYRIKQLGL
jgi:arginine utilization regulatory protein